ncbi:MAG: outer membrane protein assembly factor BamC [Candidatus Brocadia sp.]|nr:outer membrane protein assembly factor BamC [Candidatus Brocadia sp.]
MNHKGLSSTGYGIITLLLLIFLLTATFTGCATRSWGYRNMAAVSRYFDRDKSTVWDAVLLSSEGIPIEIKDKENGFLKTQWVKGWSTKRTSGLLLEGRWQERYRLLVKVTEERDKTYVSIDTQIEEKAPGGSQAYRWKRIVSDGTIEQEFLKKLENILNNQ